MSDTSTERDRADLLTTTAFANLIGVAASTLVGWIDSSAPGLPKHILTPGGQFRFRPSLVVEYLDRVGYFVPGELRERAKRDAADETESKKEGTR